MKTSKRMIGGLLLLAVAAGCAAPRAGDDLPTFFARIFSLPLPGQDVIPWPTNGWTASPPEAQGMDSTRLANLFSAARDEDMGFNTILIVRHGYLVAEGCFYPSYPGSVQPAFSITKSAISALVGIALREGSLHGLDDSVLGYFPGERWANTNERKRSMRLYDLLTMTSGLDWSEGSTNYTGDIDAMTRTDNWVRYILDLPMASQPGVVFRYDTGSVHVLSAILTRATGEDVLAYARKNLFGPLGIQAVSWSADPQGIRFGGSGLNLSPGDMAKIGYLYLHGGMWNGRSIVPADWVAQSTSIQVTVTGDTLPGWGYGYLWWIIPGLPYSAFEARGSLGQHVIVVPALDLVAVFTSRKETGPLAVEMLESYILPAVKNDGPLPANPAGEENLAQILAEIARP